MAKSAGKNVLEISGVPETMLWPLWNRAAEQKRSDRLLDDPLSAELASRIDYDFRGMFGKPHVAHVIRARLSDELIADYIQNSDDRPLVISLGEGIDTQAWRIGCSRTRWVTVDVPEAIAVREALLPALPESRCIECSALDPEWLRDIPRDASPFITAAGLLMYFNQDEVARLLAMIADFLPDATLFFDTIPPFFSQKTLRGFRVTNKYTAPPMPWGIHVDEIPEFVNGIPGVEVSRVWTYADPYPERMRFYALLARFRYFRRFAPGLVLARTFRKVAQGY